MNKILGLLPNNWLVKRLETILSSVFTFYIFQFTDEFEFFRNFWRINEKYYIYTFLAIQFIVYGFFYVLLFNFLKKLFFQSMKIRILKKMKSKKSFSDLKDINELKQFLIRFFGLHISRGLINKDDLATPIEIHENELNEVMKEIINWICLIVNLSVVSLLVWHLNAFYIFPLLIIILLIICIFWFSLTIFFANQAFIEKVRLELFHYKNGKINANP
jgi:hypothetical protein